MNRSALPTTRTRRWTAGVVGGAVAGAVLQRPHVLRRSRNVWDAVRPVIGFLECRLRVQGLH